MQLKSRRSMFFSLDAFFALTLAMLLAYSVMPYSQHHESQLLQMHQLGRDALVVKYANGGNIGMDKPTFEQLTGYSITFSSTPPLGASTAVGSKIVVYPGPCPTGFDDVDENGVPNCFKYPNYDLTYNPNPDMVYYALVSP